MNAGIPRRKKNVRMLETETPTGENEILGTMGFEGEGPGLAYGEAVVGEHGAVGWQRWRSGGSDATAW